MKQTNVVKLPRNPDLAKPKSRKATKQDQRKIICASMVGSVAVGLTALSLNHLAEGVMIVTGSQPWQAYAMAAGIDLGFVSTELALLCASPVERKVISKYSSPAIIGTLVGSAIMNAFAFSQNASSLPMSIAGVALGVSIPSLIYLFTKIAAGIWLSASK